MRLATHPAPRSFTGFLPFAGGGANAGADNTRGIEITDAFHARTRFDIDRNGFTVLRSDNDRAADGSSYAAEVEGLLRAAFRAASVVTFDCAFRQTVRSSVEIFPRFAWPANRVRFMAPRQGIDGGETEASAAALLRRVLGKRADETMRGRVMFVTVWRRLGIAARLAVCDADTVAYQDLAAVAPDHENHVRATLGFSRRHRWLDFPDLRGDEVVVMKDYDSADDGRATRCFRAAIAGDPGASDASIEVRAALIFQHT